MADFQSSPFTVLFGSFDAWVERDMLPSIDSGALDRRVMVAVVAALRRCWYGGTWGQALFIEGKPAWQLAWYERDRQCAISFGTSLSR